jgi:hypothetical protein
VPSLLIIPFCFICKAIVSNCRVIPPIRLPPLQRGRPVRYSPGPRIKYCMFFWSYHEFTLPRIKHVYIAGDFPIHWPFIFYHWETHPQTGDVLLCHARVPKSWGYRTSCWHKLTKPSTDTSLVGQSLPLIIILYNLPGICGHIWLYYITKFYNMYYFGTRTGSLLHTITIYCYYQYIPVRVSSAKIVSIRFSNLYHPLHHAYYSIT